MEKNFFVVGLAFDEAAEARREDAAPLEHFWQSEQGLD
jgi:hypothetical protein